MAIHLLLIYVYYGYAKKCIFRKYSIDGTGDFQTQET
jgi:hypothetical protein